ncbi:MAG: endonuclease/exonuclease/phosphatase family protein [Planctomycetaceae bacterium]
MSEEITQFRLMTYNIHKGIGGVDRRYSLLRIIEVIRHYQPDIVFLQEVDDGVPRSQHHRQVDMLTEALGFRHATYQKNVSVKRGHYGNAILSRFPMEEAQDLDLTISIKKRRRALITSIRIPGFSDDRPVFLCNTHLGLSGFERRLQIRRILAFRGLLDLQPRTPVIVGGDFNDVWLEHGRKLMFPSGFECAVSRAKTFPAVLPVRSLDAIYFRGDMTLQSSFAGRIKLARQASDHLPVIADFALSNHTVSESSR